MLHSSPLWHPYTRFSALREDGVPLIVRGEGSWLVADDGARYFDGTSSWWCASLGHNHPRLVAAIQRQAGVLDHSILGHLAHPGAVELARRLAALMPTPDRKVLLASDGSCAVEAGLKAALQYWANRGRPEKNRFATLDQPYHGDTVGAMSVGYLPTFHGTFSPLLFPVETLPVPLHEAEVEARLAVCHEIFRRQGPTLAGLVVEPLVQGSAGMRIYPASYLRGLARLCKEFDILLLVDEIATGFGRTGKPFAFHHAGIDPDFVFLGKALSAGTLPISALVARESIWATFDDAGEDRTFYHGHTFGGNPIACAAALAALDVYAEEGTFDRAARGESIWHAAEPTLRALPAVKETRSLGMIWAVELHPDRAQLVSRLRRGLRDRGLLVRPLGSVVYLMPPLNTPENELRLQVELLRHGIAAL